MSGKLLDGIRVADFTWVLSGPYAAMLLGLMGAEVIKIESRERPDLMRMAPNSIRPSASYDKLDTNTIFNGANLNKIGVSINLATTEGVRLAKRIVGISDIVVENMRPGTMDKLGLGYKHLVKIKPDIIMLSASAFGATGPFRNYTGFHPHFAAFGGLIHISGYEDGEPDTLTPSIDTMVGTTCACAIMAALNYRDRTGKGQFIDLSSSESLSVLIGDVIMDYTMNGEVPRRIGNNDAIMAPHNCYRCKGEDKWISIAVSNDKEWNALCKAMGNPEWTKDKLFTDQYSRWQNRKQLDQLIGRWTINFTHYDIMNMLQKVGVAAMPSFSDEEIFNDIHTKARHATTSVTHPAMGECQVFNSPWKFSRTPALIEKASPLLGEHNEYVFGELLGMSQKKIAQLVEQKVLY